MRKDLGRDVLQALLLAEAEKHLQTMLQNLGRSLELSTKSTKLPPYTLAGFDLTTHSYNVLGGKRRRYHFIHHAARAYNFL
jgi:hypothetical protein